MIGSPRIRACYPCAGAASFDLSLEPLEIVDRLPYRVDFLNQLRVLSANSEPFVGFAEQASIRNDGPAGLRFERLFSVDGGTYFSVTGAVVIGAGTTGNAISAAGLVFPTYPFLKLRFTNIHAVLPLTAHVTYTLRTQWPYP